MRYLIMLTLFPLLLSAQNEIKKVAEINTDAEMVDGDILGNIYIIKGTDVAKYDENGVLCCTFSDKNYGEITSIDTRDPLRILFFYKPFGIVRFLDNKLAEQSTIDLRSLELTDPRLVCTSETQGFWVYDNATSKLYKYNSMLQQISLSNDLRQEVMHGINPVKMEESDYWLVILDQNALLVFDKMGTYFKEVPVENSAGGQLIHDDWVYLAGDKIIRINLRNGKRTEITPPFAASQSQILVTPVRLLRLNETRLEIYSY